MREKAYGEIKSIKDFKDERARKVAEEFDLMVDEIPYLSGTLAGELEHLEKGREKSVMKKLAASSVVNYELTKREAFEIREHDGDKVMIPRTHPPKGHEYYARNHLRGAEYVKKSIGYTLTR